MKLRELFAELIQTQQKIGTTPVKLCGGVPRDRYLNNIKNIEDIDLTSGDKTIQYTAQEFGIKLAKQYNIIRKTYDDGHSSIHIGDLKIDFSSNFNIDGITEILNKIGIKNPTNMQKEMYSRDFTCNALLLSLDFKTISDPTNNGLKDLDKKIIRTCLKPEITLTTNKNRVVRAIYLSAKLDFDIDSSIISFVAKNPASFNISSHKAVSEKLKEAFEYNPERASFYISKMGLWDYIPITEAIQPYYIKSTVKTSQRKVKSVRAIDFSLDNQITPIVPCSDVITNLLDVGGLGYPVKYNDFEDKPQSTLDFTNDYTSDIVPEVLDKDKLKELIEKYLNHDTKTELFGMSDGFDHEEDDELQSKTKNKYNNEYGPQTLIYEGIPIIAHKI